MTPLRVSLAPGTYNVEITAGPTSRTLPITVEAGSVVSQYVELATATATIGGRLEIGSDQPGAQVALDGAPKGVTPLVLNDVPVGQHRVTVSVGREHRQPDGDGDARRHAVAGDFDGGWHGE